jgi:ABC-type transport system substrate-binding protein
MYPRLQSGEVPFYFGGWVCTTGDASDLFDHKVHSEDLERGYGSSNSNRYHHPELDRLIEESGRLLNMVQRREILQQALDQLATGRAFLPLYAPFELYGVRQGITWTPRHDERIYAFEMMR